MGKPPGMPMTITHTGLRRCARAAARMRAGARLWRGKKRARRTSRGAGFATDADSEVHILAAAALRSFELLGGDDVVDAEDHGRDLRRALERLRLDAEGLDDVVAAHVLDLAGVEVDAGRLLALLVRAAEVDEDVDRVEPSVLGER